MVDDFDIINHGNLDYSALIGATYLSICSELKRHPSSFRTVPNNNTHMAMLGRFDSKLVMGEKMNQICDIGDSMAKGEGKQPPGPVLVDGH